MRGSAVGIVAVALGLLAVSAAPASAATVSSLSYTSDPGDFVGQGQSVSVTSVTRGFTITGGAASVGVLVRDPSPAPHYILNFAAPKGQTLVTGRTYNAVRTTDTDAQRAGMAVQADGRTCNQLYGTFTVLDIATRPDGFATRFRATFEQHCEGAAPALRGEVAYGVSDTPAPPPGLPRDLVKPVLSTPRLSSSVFRPRGAGPTVAARRKRATRVSYRLSEPARVGVVVERRAKGRKVGRRCVRQRSSNRTGRRCTLWPRRGSFSVQGKEGPNSFVFTGRIRNKALSSGRYRFVAQAIDAAGNRSPRRAVPFRIARR